MNIKSILIYILSIGILTNTYAQTFNQYFTYNNTNTLGGNIVINNNIARFFYVCIDTTYRSFGSLASFNGIFNVNNKPIYNPSYRPNFFWQYATPSNQGKIKIIDNGYLSPGFARDTNGIAYAIISKFDTNGLVLFYNKYNHFESESFDAIKMKNKNRYLITGRAIESGAGTPIYIQADSVGNELYYRYYDHPEFRYYDNNVIARSIVELDSGNALLVCDGVNDNLPSPLWRYATPVKTILIKVDSVGNELWRWLDPSNDSRCAFSFQKTSDGGFISCGFNFGYRDTVNQRESYQPSIIKWNSDLSIEWKKWYDDNRKDSIGGALYDIKELSDGSFIACGRGGETNINSTIRGGLIVKVDKNGNLLWRKYYTAFPDSSANLNINNTLYDIDVFDNGDIIAVGETQPTWGIVQRAWILRTDSNGCIVDSNWCGWNSIEVEPIPTPNPSQEGNELRIFPNPANDIINISINQTCLSAVRFKNLKIENYKLDIYDAIGHRVNELCDSEEGGIYDGVLQYKLNINKLNRGMYFISILDKENNIIGSGKFVKE